MPLDHLFINFVIDTRFHLCQLTPNVIRIVLEVSELNSWFNLRLGLNEIKYYHILSEVEDKWNLRAKPTSPSIIKGLASSHKRMYNDVVVITRNIEPDLMNRRVPRQFGSPGL